VLQNSTASVFTKKDKTLTGVNDRPITVAGCRLFDFAHTRFRQFSVDVFSL
jgi:hypothetical protein